MEISLVNKKILSGEVLQSADLPALASSKLHRHRFDIEFGLDTLPTEPGLIVVRGARQYGKSTWLESELKKSYEAHGRASCFHLNCDDVSNERELFEHCSMLISLLQVGTVKRLFIDEISAVDSWQNAIKRLWDKGISRDVLIVTTGSHADDLLSGSELLPGRKGKLARSAFIFTPVSYLNFTKFADLQGQDKIVLYLLSGGSPLACNSLLQQGHLEPYVLQLVRDWILGAIARSGRTRAHALATLREIFARGGTPASLLKIAKETGLANNTVALGYIELFVSCLVLNRSVPFDFVKKKVISRKESKFHFINLLCAVAFSPYRLHSIEDWKALPRNEQGKWIEWLVAQELWRRNMIAGASMEEVLPFLSLKDKEVDFLSGGVAYEVKRGSASPEEFYWFHKSFPKTRLIVVCSTPFETDWCRGVTLEDFLLCRD